MKDQTRNLNPHAEALLHSWIFGKEYSEQHGGVMDFWYKATEQQQRHAKDNLDKLLCARRC